MTLQPSTAESWKAVADLIDRRIGKLGLTTTEVANRADVSTQTIRSLLTGKRTTYRPGSLRAISRALQWSPLALEEFAASWKEPLEAVATAAPVSAESMAMALRRLELKIDQVQLRVEEVLSNVG